MGSYKTKQMAVQQEIKSQLAKLLATEDIVVEHKQVESAQFNVRARVLILPLWEKASNNVYDMLVGHEVGHALFTPDEDWWVEHDIPQTFVNVVEDARIEKLMKRKYMGLAKSFYKGYSELHDKDFFELDGQDIDSLNLADRANLHFKLSSILPVYFSSIEKPIITLIQNAETFTDTIAAAEALYNFCKQEKEETLQNQQQAKVDFEQDLESSGDRSTDSIVDNQPTVSDTNGSSSLEDRSDSTFSNDRMVASDPVVETAEKLESKLQDLVNTEGRENEYIEIPEVNLDNIIATNKEVHEEIDRYWEYEQRMWEDKIRGFDEVDNGYIDFKREAQKEVNYLVKEFECKKAAIAYARASTSKTGVLNTEKLFSYKFTEDLFKKITVLPDGKNHGLVFILDWSGSMQYVLQDTCKQLYNLMWFCRKVQIPFEVYAFTQEWNNKIVNYETGEYLPSPVNIKYKKKEGVFQIADEFNLMNLFSSKVNAKILDHQMLNIWRIAQAFKHGTVYGYPSRLVLSGTPLNETLICLHQILPQFKKENNIEKVQCVVLTDGEAHTLPYHKLVQRHWESGPYMGCRGVNPSRCFLRDRRLGKVYRFDDAWHSFTDVILQNLKDNFPFTNFIGIRVLSNRDANSFIRLYYPSGNATIQNDWKKLRSFTIKNSGYDAYFGLASTTLSQDSEFDVDEDATKAQIKRAFVKSLKTKKLNKKVLGEFISLVA